MIYEHFKKTLIFIGRTTTPSISFANRQFEIAFILSIINYQLSIIIVHCSLIIEH